MADREKVIRDLEYLVSFGGASQQSMVMEIAMESLELLKEQEAIKPLAQEDDTYECGCGAIVGWDELDASGIVTTHFNYCPFCGKAVKWNA